MPEKVDLCDNPTNLDLHTTQARHSVLLEALSENVTEIKAALLGDDGVILEVDRLKRSQKLSNTIFWAVFLAAVGTTGTVAAAFIVDHW